MAEMIEDQKYVLTSPADSTRSIVDLKAEHEGYKRPVVRSEQSGIGHIVVYGNTPAEEEIQQLSLLATQLNYQDKLPEAILALNRAQAIARAIDQEQTAAWWCRLPLFQQAAGQYGDSMRSFCTLLEYLWQRRAHQQWPRETQIKLALAAIERSYIFDKMRLANQREKRWLDALHSMMLSQAFSAIRRRGFCTPDEWPSNIDNVVCCWDEHIDKLLKRARINCNEELKQIASEFMEDVQVPAITRVHLATIKSLSITPHERFPTLT